MNAQNIIALLNAAVQLAPVAESLIGAAKLAITEGRDATPDELKAAVEGDAEASEALDKWLAAP